jgi:AcrR family transcriptional regulator
MATKLKRRPAARLDGRTRAARGERGNARAGLLAAAAEVFAARGYRDASVDEVAERAGYSKGAVYWHFESKDDLFLALVDERIDAPMRDMVALLESAAPEHDMALEGSRRFVDLLSRERQLLLLELEYRSFALRDPALRRRYVSRRNRLGKALARALRVRSERLGAPVAVDFEAIATVLMSLIAGLAQQRLLQPQSVPDELLGDTIALIYRGGVARAADGARVGA